MFRTRTILAALVAASLLITPGAASAEEPAPPARVTMLIPAAVPADGTTPAQEVCLVLPYGTTTATISRLAAVRAAGLDRPIIMTVRPFAVTGAEPLAERVAVREPVVLTDPRLAGVTCFGFENPISAEEASGVAKPYQYFAQEVTIETRSDSPSPIAASSPALFFGADAQEQSPPVTLAGGAYLAEWDTGGPTTPGSSIDLRSADTRGMPPQTILGLSSTGGTASGRAYLYNVKPGAYYASAHVPGRWSVRLTPITP